MTGPFSTSFLAYAPEPLVDEALDGWIHHVAATLRTDPADVLAAAGVRAGPTFSPLRDLTSDQAHRLSEATGFDEQVWERMTLRPWSRIGLVPPAQRRGFALGVWAKGRTPSACPDCLTERGTRPRLQWWVHWSFACTRHRRFLVRPLHPETDRQLALLPVGPDTEVSETLGTDHGALMTQAAVDDLLARPAEPITYLGAARPGWEFLRDLAALTRLLLATPGATDPEGLVRMMADRGQPEWLEHPWTWDFERDCSPARQMSQATMEPTLMAFAATLAHRVLRSPTPEEATAELWWMTPRARAAAVSHAQKRHLSWPLARVLNRARGPQRPGSIVVLRFGLTHVTPEGARRVPLDPCKVPASCWPSVVVPVSAARRDVSGVALSCALLCIGSTTGVREALLRFDLPDLEARVRADWHHTFADHDDAAFDSLVDLHDALVEADVPIDYSRRRATFTGPVPLGRNRSRRIARALDVRETDRLIRFSSWFLYDLLTGSNPLLTPDLIDLWGQQRIAYRRLRAAWMANTPMVFLEIAEQELLRRRIDEPVAWQPLRLDGRWTVPAEGSPHLLPAWHATQRSMRRSSLLQRSDLDGLSIVDAVAFASHGGTPTARYLARLLTRFHVIARSGSISAGARELGLAQSTASTQLGALERLLQTRLLDRSNGITTPEGRRAIRLLVGHQRAALTTPREDHPAPPTPPPTLSTERAAYRDAPTTSTIEDAETNTRRSTLTSDDDSRHRPSRPRRDPRDAGPQRPHRPRHRSGVPPGGP